MLTPDEWVALIGAFTLLIGGVSAAIVSVVRAGAEAAKTRAEVAAMRADLAAAAEKDKERADNQDRLLKEAHHELTPNGGGSLKDATTRLEAAVAELRDGLRAPRPRERGWGAVRRGRGGLAVVRPGRR